MIRLGATSAVASPASPASIGLIALILALTQAHLAAAEGARVSVTVTDGEPQATVALVAELAERPYRLADDLLAAPEQLPEAVTIVFHQADAAAVHQALAHALGCWWYRSAGGEWWLTRSEQAPAQSPLRVARYSTGMGNRPRRLRLARDLLAPWLHDPAAGIAIHEGSGLVTATLDDAGHGQLQEVLTLLDAPRPILPAIVVDAATPRPEARLINAISTRSTNALATALAAGTGRTVSLGPGLAGRELTVELEPMPLVHLPAALAPFGLNARWVQGVLCLDERQVADRRLPAHRRRIAIIPLPHLLRGDEIDAARFVITLRAAVQPDWWRHESAVMEVLQPEQALLVTADLAVLATLYDELERLDRAGGAEASADE